mgnify:CR=1 FL=1|jgi:hypothetical protein
MPDRTECYQTSESVAPFIRLETPRERIALPYTTLLGVTLSVDETTLALDFADRQVTVRGKRLHEVFCALARGRVEAVFARPSTDELLAGPANTAPMVAEIRISLLDRGDASD